MRDDRERLRDIDEAIEKIEKYVSIGYQAFIEDERTQVWIIHHLQVIGEASNHLSDELTEQNQDIPWADIVGLRNILVHQYFGIDLRQVWETAELDMPILKSKVREILQEINDKLRSCQAYLLRSCSARGRLWPGPSGAAALSSGRAGLSGKRSGSEAGARRA